MLIRPERTDDFAAIAKVVEAAFGSPVEAGLVESVRASSRYVPELALVAERDGAVVGHVMISGATLRDDGAATEREIAMLSPLAVLPACHGQGIGSALVRTVTRLADEQGEPIVVLTGDPAFYGRFGFEYATPLGLHVPVPSWAPPEGGQLLRLTGYDPSLRGRVVFPPGFDED